MVLVYGFLAAAYKVRCFLTGDSGIKAHINKVVSGATHRINHHANEAASEGFNSANVTQITLALDVEVEVFSFGRASVGIVCSVVGNRCFLQEWEIVTEKHSSLTDKCFPSGSKDSYTALAGQ